MNPLLDSNFLIKLNNDKNRTIYAHVISLNQYEHPIEQIEPQAQSQLMASLRFAAFALLR